MPYGDDPGCVPNPSRLNFGMEYEEEVKIFLYRSEQLSTFLKQIFHPAVTKHCREDSIILPQHRWPAMPNVIYTLNNAIESFFSDGGSSSSRIQCDDFVRRRYGGQIWPVDIQGSSSYTVIAGPSGNKIMQFREKAALLDMTMMALAKDIHGDVVPSCSELGWVGDPNGSQLAVYEMDRLPGENYVTARPYFTSGKRLNTVHSLARFVGTVFTSSLRVNLLT